MNHQNEARLDRSLQNQIKAPRLDARFDAAVWSRIDAAEAWATNPVAKSRAEKLSRWMFVSNAVGGLVVVVLGLYFGLRAFGGVEISVSLPAALPNVSDAVVSQVVMFCGYLLTFLVLGFVFAITPFGRRLRAHFY